MPDVAIQICVKDWVATSDWNIALGSFLVSCSLMCMCVQLEEQ